MTSARARIGVLFASCALCCAAALGAAPDPRGEEYVKRAFSEVDKIPDEAAKAYLYFGRRFEQTKAGDETGAAESLRRLAEVAAHSKDDFVKRLYANQASDDRARHGDVEGVLQLFQKTEPYAKSSALQHLGGDRQEGVDLATKKQLLAHAFHAAQEITKRSNNEEDEGHASKYQLLFFIAVDQGKARDEEGALRTIKAIPLDGQQGSLFHYLACCYEAIRFAKNGNEEGSLALIDEATRSLGTFEDIPIPKRGQVRKKATTIESNLSKLAEAQSAARKVADAIKTAERLQSPERKAQALGEVARVRLEANDIEGSAQAIHAMETSHAKVDALLALAKVHLDAKAIDKAKTAVKEAHEVAQAIPGAEKSRTLRETSEAQARLGDFAAAAESAGAILAPAERAHAWRKLSKFQQAAGDAAGATKSIELALTHADEVSGNSWKADFYYVAGQVLASLGDRKKAASAYKKASEAASAITDPRASPTAEMLAGWILAEQYRLGELADAEDTLQRMLRRARELPPRPNSPFPGYEATASLMALATALTTNGVDEKHLAWIKELSTATERAYANLGAARGFQRDFKRKDD